MLKSSQFLVLSDVLFKFVILCVGLEDVNIQPEMCMGRSKKTCSLIAKYELSNRIRGVGKPATPNATSTKLGLQSFKYIAARLRNSRSDKARTAATVPAYFQAPNKTNHYFRFFLKLLLRSFFHVIFLVCFSFLSCSKIPPPPGKGGYSQKNWIRVYGPLSKSVTLFMT